MEKQPIQTTATFNGIDQPYFNIVQDHGDKLFLFIQKLNDNPRLKEEVDNAIHFHSTGKPAEIPFPDLINMLISADLLKVYQQLGYRFGIDKRRALPSSICLPAYMAYRKSHSLNCLLPMTVFLIVLPITSLSLKK